MAKKEIVFTENAPEAIGPYSQAVKAGPFVFVSGQIAINPQTGELVEGGVEEQTEMVLKNLQAVVEASGATLTDVVKCNLYFQDLKDFEVVNNIYGRFFAENPPARAAVEVSRLPKDVLIEIEAIAMVGSA